MSKQYIVRGACGREWSIPAHTVRADYKRFVVEQDGLDDADAEAYVEAHFDQDVWWREQCLLYWEFVEEHGTETSNSAPRFKTRKALDNNRGREPEEVRRVPGVGRVAGDRDPAGVADARHRASDDASGPGDYGD